MTQGKQSKQPNLNQLAITWITGLGDNTEVRDFCWSCRYLAMVTSMNSAIHNTQHPERLRFALIFPADVSPSPSHHIPHAHTCARKPSNLSLVALLRRTAQTTIYLPVETPNPNPNQNSNAPLRAGGSRRPVRADHGLHPKVPRHPVRGRGWRHPVCPALLHAPRERRGCHQGVMLLCFRPIPPHPFRRGGKTPKRPIRR
eukprot:9496708-Pyramimonas_sp.AAC.1